MKKNLKKVFNKWIIKFLPVSFKEEIYYSLELDRGRIFRQVKSFLEDNGLAYNISRSDDLSLSFDILDDKQTLVASITGALLSSLLTNPTSLKRYIEDEVLPDYNAFRPN